MILGNALSVILGILFFPVTVLGSFFTIEPGEEVIVLMWGKFRKRLQRPGLYWVNIFGCKLIRISVRRQAIELPKSVVADGNGNPIIVSGIVTFYYSDTERAALSVEHANEYVRSQAQAVLKQIASRYPYESSNGCHSLKSEAKSISQELVAALQGKVEAAGAVVLSFELSDLAYAPEIAQAMLIRQQALALIDARKIIVEGAVEIVRDAVQMLESKGLALDEDTRHKLVSNLLTVICGEAEVQPTIPVDGVGAKRAA